MSFKIPEISFKISNSAPIITGTTVPSFGAKKSGKEAATNTLKQSKNNPAVSSPLVENQPVKNPLKFIDKYVNKEVVQHALETNPNIKAFLEYRKIPVVISEKNIDSSLKRHLFTTYLYAIEIAKQSKLDPETTKKIAKAALVHDIGKALIPESLIQKPGKLTPAEKEIVKLHTILGTEILKTTDIDPEIADAIGNHHTHTKHSKSNVISRVLAVADVYSALKEQRPYKEPMTDDKAFELMFNMPRLSQKYVKDLAQHRYMTKLF